MHTWEEMIEIYGEEAMRELEENDHKCLNCGQSEGNHDTKQCEEA